MSRRLQPLPQRKLDVDRKANSDVEVRQMTAEEHEKQAAAKPRERDVMTWKPTRRKEVGD
ncbi:hypothetical protein AB4Z17_11665 [Paenibacillus sp. TAF43_2]|uniref:hypothetical protein n=1 Tax=Paenibacillus sp. TAF43_2 TaxID=3233069 RepID=UPI003F98DD86